MLICKKPKIFDIDLYGLGLVVGICALNWLFLIPPIEKKLVALQQEQQNYLQKKDAAQQELAHLRKIDLYQKNLAARLSQTADPLPDNPGIDEIIRRLCQFCLDCNLRLDQVTPRSDTISEYYRKTSLIINVSGAYPDFHNFLVRIMNELKFVRVDTFTINNLKNTPEAGCKIAVNLDIFSPS